MEKAANALRRSGAFLLTYGGSHQDLDLIIVDLKGLKSQMKLVRDSQQRILEEIWTWSTVHENRPLKEVFSHLSNLNNLWSEVQTQLVEQINDFKHQFEMILEGERNLDAARYELSNCESAEEKAQKKLKKAEKKNAIEDIRAAQAKVEECKNQKEFVQNEISQKVSENEAVKLIRLKSGLLKLSEAYIAFAQKCKFIFEAQRDIVKCLPDVEDKAIHEMAYNGLPGAENIVQRARMYVEEYSATPQQSSQPRGTDPPPPYSAGPAFSTPPFNPYYLDVSNTPERPSRSSTEGGSLYPRVSADEELARAMKAAKI